MNGHSKFKYYNIYEDTTSIFTYFTFKFFGSTIKIHVDHSSSITSSDKPSLINSIRGYNKILLSLNDTKQEALMHQWFPRF